MLWGSVKASRADSTSVTPDRKSAQDWRVPLERLRVEPAQPRRAVGRALTEAFGHDAALLGADKSGTAAGHRSAFLLANEDELRPVGLSCNPLRDRLKAWQTWLWLDDSVRNRLSFSPLVESAEFESAVEHKRVNSDRLGLREQSSLPRRRALEACGSMDRERRTLSWGFKTYNSGDAGSPSTFPRPRANLHELSSWFHRPNSNRAVSTHLPRERQRTDPGAQR